MIEGGKSEVLEKSRPSETDYAPMFTSQLSIYCVTIENYLNSFYISFLTYNAFTTVTDTRKQSDVISSKGWYITFFRTQLLIYEIPLMVFL